MTAATVRTTVWHEDRVAIVEDIPAHVCDSCVEQFYDEDVSDALRRLVEKGLPAEDAQREITVPVFSLEGRIRKRKPLPEDSYVD
jgi:YgiT-type zinc finger domain-containing protein